MQDFCDKAPKHRYFHVEVIRALLYMEQSVLVVELVRDFCFASIPHLIGDNWVDIINRYCHVGCYEVSCIENDKVR